MRVVHIFAAIVVLLASAARPGPAADNTLTAKEKAAGWELLFDGTDKDFKTNWICNNGKPISPKAKIEEGAMTAFQSGGYLVVYKDPSSKGPTDKDQFGDFILKCDIKMATPRCNSGIFLRTGNLKDVVQTGLEMQVSHSVGTSRHDYGAIYDLAAPTKPVKRNVGGWDHVTITCKGPRVTVEINGETIVNMNCDEYATPRKNPDGTRNKFRKAIKDFPRRGYIGFQDHHDGTKALYKNIKILRLDKK